MSSLIAAGIGAVGSLIGGAMQSKSTRDTNRTNLQIAREQNQFNLEQWKREVAYNDAQWDKQNAYNTPEQQMRRYEAAGINPFMAVSNIQAGNAEAMTAPNSKPAVGATMQPTDYSFVQQAASNGINMYYQTKMQDVQIQNLREQTRNQEIENQYLASIRAAELRKLGEEGQAKLLENQFSADTYADRLATQTWTKDKTAQEYLKLKEETELRRTETAIAKWNLKVNNPQQLALAIQQTRSIVALQASQSEVNKQQARVLAKQVLKTQAETFGLTLNNEVLDKSVDYLVTGNFARIMDNGYMGTGLSVSNLIKAGVYGTTTKHVQRNWRNGK